MISAINSVVPWFFAAAVTFGTVCGASAPRPVATVPLTAEPMQKFELTGTVRYARSSEVSFEAKGRLAYIAPAGTVVRGRVLDSAGRVVVPGDLLARQDTAIPESDVKIAEVMRLHAEAVLQERDANFRRDKVLVSKSAISDRQYQETKMLYETAVIGKERAELDFLRARQVLDACFIRAPFDAVVEEVFCSDGSAVDVANAVLKIGMIDPAGVVMEFDDNTLAVFDRTMRIAVYPDGAAEPVPGRVEGPPVVNGALVCYVANPVVSEPVFGPDGRRLAVLGELSTVHVLPGRAASAACWVAEGAIVRRHGGRAFVWRLLDDAGRPLAAAQPVPIRLEQVFVEPLDLQLMYGNLLLRAIKADSGLKAGNVLAADAPEQAVTGMTAVCRRKHRLFQPQQKVRVEFISDGSRRCFPIPAAALRVDPKTGKRTLLLNDAGRVRVVAVTQLSERDGIVRVFAPELEGGQLLILPESAPGLKSGDAVICENASKSSESASAGN